MTETTHTRSRNASLFGLIIQVFAFVGALVVSLLTNSNGAFHLAWYLLGGVPIWFVSLLVARQRELAALEALDLEELRRERQSTGGGEAMFDEDGSGGLGYRIAEVRLHWMLRWLVPVFSLATAVYLAAMGAFAWRKLTVNKLHLSTGDWAELLNVPIGMVVLAIIMLGTFLFSRYASGMGRVREWQTLRGCGAYMLGNALFIVALLLCLGVHQYAGAPEWERALAYIIPGMMIVLAIETLINFVLDIYRPRAAGDEPRPAFDSRLLGLFAEPGGIAHSIAEAINYQFGFQVSQTWFYKLLERAFVPLLAIGALVLWGMTTIVIVQPYEHVIIERFGEQQNAEQPYGPGIHFKAPWPIDVARAYNTGALHHIDIGYEQFAAVPAVDDVHQPVILWTDATHFKLSHFDFLLSPPARSDTRSDEGLRDQSLSGGEAARDEQPVNLIRAEVAVQYRIRPDGLVQFTNTMENPHRLIRVVAWEEMGRYLASLTVEQLLGERLVTVGAEMQQRIAPRANALGLEVIYVGMTNVHPEKSVAEAYRNVVQAEQEKIASIRTARVAENQRLSAVAGDARRARDLAEAIENSRAAEATSNEGAPLLSSGDPAAVAALESRLEPLRPLFEEHVVTRARFERLARNTAQAERDFALGLGATVASVKKLCDARVRAESHAAAAKAALETQLETLRGPAAEEFDGRTELVDAVIADFTARVAGAVWRDFLAEEFTQTRLGGEAAETLASAAAQRWQIEMTAAGEVSRVQNEREAYRAAPDVYRARRLMEVLVDGIADARKFFLAFDPGDRKVRVRFIAEDEADMDVLNLRPTRDQNE